MLEQSHLQQQSQAMRRAVAQLCLQHDSFRNASSEAASQLQEPLLRLAPEVVAFVANRGQGTLAMPAELVRAVEKAVARREGRHITIQAASTDLTDDLRNRSRTKGKGGSRLMPHKELEHRVKEEPSRSELKHMLKKLVAAGPMPADRVDIAADEVAATSGEMFLLTAPWTTSQIVNRCFMDVLVQSMPLEAMMKVSSALERRRKIKRHHEPAMAYDDMAAAAYAASRMPACYAVVERIMQEMAFSHPDWRPRTMLDFGAGPATAAWAAGQVWKGHPPLQVQAVERSDAMAELGHETGQQISGSCPSIRWASSLPGLTPVSHRSSKGKKEWMRGRPTHRHDLVTACYVLSEIEDSRQRQRVVEALWQSTGETLLIAEPGTPIGSAIVRAARWQILNLEGAGGAHVQAPCPHDGVCPMDGGKSWCHFRQRFQRPALQRRSRRPTNNTAPRSYQDERFSYVVLTRGPRPAYSEAQLADEPIAGHSESASTNISQGSGRLQPESGVSSSDDEAADWGITEQELRLLDPATRQLVLDSIESGSESDEPDLGLLSADLHETGEHVNRITSEADLAEDSSAMHDAASSIHASYQHRGLQDSETAGLLSSPSQQDAVAISPQPPSAGELRQAASSIHAALPGSPTTMQPRGPPAPAASSSSSQHADAHPNTDSLVPLRPMQQEPFSSHQMSSSEADLETDSESEGEEDMVLDEDDLEAALAASRSWSRVVRKPRTRHRHVILDVCAAKRTATGHATGEGQLLQQVVSKADIAWAGAKGYRIARKTRWGDLWPTFFQDAAITVSQKGPGSLE